ncbi:MAG: hypothetical protein H8E21_18225 [Gammaproteobacteria bacterium]|nr:hypothetical protein [Gammaproteobacteria bacterium]
MDALISGKARVAALITGDDAALIDNSGNIMKKSNYGVIARQFQSYDDTLYIKKTTHTDTIKKLKIESDKSDALLMMITVLDSSIPEISKPEILNILDNLFSHNCILSYIRGVIYSRPLNGELIGKSSNLLKNSSSITVELIKNLISSQNKIQEIYFDLVKTATSFQADSNDLKTIEGVFVNNQLMYHFCQNSVAKQVADEIRFNCLSRLNSIKNYRQIINKLFHCCPVKN